MRQVLTLRCLLATIAVSGLAGGALHAQDPTLLLEQYRKDWKDQAGVMIKYHTTIRIENTKEGVTATKTVEHERIALKAPAGQSDREEVGYSKLIPLEGINAWTMVPKETSYKKINVEEFSHRDEVGSQIFFDDSRNVQFLYPAVATGAITHLDYTLKYPDARMVTGHYFASGYPVEESTFTVISDKDVEVVASMFHMPEDAVKHEQVVERGKNVQRWTMTNVPALQIEDQAPGIRYYIPHMQLMVRKPGEKAGTDLERMYAWNREHVRDAILLDDDTMLVRIAREQTAGLDNDRAKAAALYTWVQDHIKYVAVEDGMNGLIPAMPAAVCNARYGDCKGMANLLRALMHNAGLKAHLTWVGSRQLPYSYDDLPAPMTDDHMITAWEMSPGEFMILDPTSSETPFGMPSGFIQGKQALIGIDADNFKVVDVPVMPADMNRMIDTVHARLDGNTLKGSGTTTFTGYQRATMSEIFKRVEKKKWKDVMRNMYMKGNNRYIVDTVTVVGLDDRTGPLVVSYTFSLPGYSTTLGGEQYVHRMLVNSFDDRYYRKERKLPVEEEYCWTADEVVFIELPTGTTTGFVPEHATHKGGSFSYAMRTTAVPGAKDAPTTVKLENGFRMEKLMMQPEDLAGWRTMLDQLDRDMNRTIVLK